MARATPTTTQDDPTRPRPVDDLGQLLDGHGLPINGPGRAAALKGRPDPALEAPADAPAPVALEEK